jgi:hypothetical protein
MSSSARHKSVKFSESIDDINQLKAMEQEEGEDEEEDEEEELVPMKAATSFVEDP